MSDYLIDNLDLTNVRNVLNQMTLHLNTPKAYDVINDMKAKGIKATVLIADTGLSSCTFYRFINEQGGSSQRTIQTIINYVNNYKP